jgi:hypothetical protein
MFSRSDNFVAPSERLLRTYFETGNDKFKMARAYIGTFGGPELYLSQGTQTEAILVAYTSMLVQMFVIVIVSG